MLTIILARQGGDFRTFSRHIYETMQDRTKVAIDH